MKLFRLQKYKKFESNSQPTKSRGACLVRLFRLQKYKKFESNSQLLALMFVVVFGCFDCKSTKNLRAIHNSIDLNETFESVVSTAKVQKI